MWRVAQTNIQLLNQMREAGYSVSDAEKVNDAYLVASELCSGKLRGCGKPVQSHLVGTASILTKLGRPVDTLRAALLHAAYENGDFGLDDPRVTLERAAGEEVTTLVDTYQALAWEYSGDQVRRLLGGIDARSEVDREALLIRLANELDDHLDLSPHYHGGDGYKGAEWRLERMHEVEQPMVELCNALGFAELGQWIEEAFDENRQTSVPASLRSDHNEMWFLPPRTASFDSAWVWARRRARRVPARLRRLLIERPPTR